jgi:hypothetical protein
MLGIERFMEIPVPKKRTMASVMTMMMLRGIWVKRRKIFIVGDKRFLKPGEMRMKIQFRSDFSPYQM